MRISRHDPQYAGLDADRHNGSEASTRSMFRERVQAKQVAGDLAIHLTDGIVITPGAGIAWKPRKCTSFSEVRQDSTVVATHAITE